MALGLSSDKLASFKKYAVRNADGLVAETIKICEIPAPSYEEQERGHYLKSRFEEYGMTVRVDEVGNIIAFKKGNVEGKPNLMFAAHIDTVFPIETVIKVEKKGNRLFAPGIRDNSAGAASIVFLAKALTELNLEHGDIYLVGTVCEEGLGDLKGIKAAYAKLKDKVDYVIAVDGGLGGVIHAGIGSRRLKVSVSTGGGHSWGAFGSPSAVHALGAMIYHISKLSVPKSPRTTYNVGVIEGGTSINTIAANAEMLIDMRSESKKPLYDLEEKVRTIISQISKEYQVNYKIDVVGDRPVGSLKRDHELFRKTTQILDYLKLPKHIGAGSTDCNVPLSDGKPAICVGVTTGKNAHRLDESMDITPFALGFEQLILLIEML